MNKQENLPAVIGDTEVDKEIVQEAVHKIQTILTEHFGKASYEVVDYLYENFFGSNIENLKKKKLDNHKSFQALLEEFHGKTGKSKSWIYESIALWLDRDLMVDVKEYENLSLSHKVLLLKIKEKNEKTDLAVKFSTEMTSYREAKKGIRHQPNDTDYSTLTRLINHPNDFDEEQFKEKTRKTQLKNIYKNLKDKQRFEIVKRAKERVETIEKQIELQEKILDRAKSIKKQLELISDEIMVKE